MVMRWGGFKSLETTFRGGARPESFTDDDIARYRRAMARPGALTAAINYYRALRLPESYTLPIVPIELPVLVVWGDRDPYLGAELADPPADLIPDGRVVHIPTSGHWVHLDEADRVNRLLVDFLAEPRDGAAVKARPEPPQEAALSLR
jgi:pimeloyl-ACP methyl ester carboxylesterase